MHTYSLQSIQVCVYIYVCTLTCKLYVQVSYKAAFPYLLVKSYNMGIFKTCLLVFLLGSSMGLSQLSDGSGGQACLLNPCLSFQGILKCDPLTNEVQAARALCVTLDFEFEGNNRSRFVAGLCEFAYTNHSYLTRMRVSLPTEICSSAELNDLFCGPTHRNGTLCSHCQNGFTINVNSPTFECMPLTSCSDSAWVIYLIEQLLPLTGLFLVVVILQVNLFSPRYRIMVLFGQLIALPINIISINTGLEMAFPKSPPFWISKIISALYDPLNLNVPSFLLPENCFSSKIDILHVIVLEYLKAVYPLTLCVILHVLIELHRFNCRLVVVAWRPFSRFFVRFQRYFNSKTSIMDAFVTFILLAYTKFIVLLVVITLPIKLYGPNGEVVKHVLFFDGSVKFLGPYHLLFVLVVLVLYIMFIVVPIVFFLLYQTAFFQQLLRRCRLHQLALMTIVDVFLGYYKDGTNGTRDLRYFSGIFSILQLVLVVFRCVAVIGEHYILYSTLVSLVASTVFFCIRPFKCQWYNNLNGLAFLYGTGILYLYLQLRLKVTAGGNTQAEILVMCVALLLPALYFAFFMVVSFFNVRAGYRDPLIVSEGMLESSFPDRLNHPDTYECQYGSSESLNH